MKKYDARSIKKVMESVSVINEDVESSKKSMISDLSTCEFVVNSILKDFSRLANEVKSATSPEEVKMAGDVVNKALLKNKETLEKSISSTIQSVTKHAYGN